MSLKKNTSKSNKKRSKKDLLSGAVRDEFEKAHSSKEFLDSLETTKATKAASKKSNEKARESADSASNTEEYEPGFEWMSERRQNEKDLSSGKENQEHRNMSNSLPEKSQSKGVPPAALDLDDEVGSKNKVKILSVLAAALVVAALAGLYFYFFGSVAEPKIYLSTEKITEETLPSLTGLESGFPKNMPIYIYFAPGKNLGVEQISIEITEVLSAADGATKEKQVAEFDATVQPEWKKLDTYFQAEFFEHAGTYRIRILTPEGKALAERTFKVTD